MYSYLCTELVTRCSDYAHIHCTSCNGVLTAIGGGGDDGRGIDGYEDEHGNSFVGVSIDEA